MMDSVFLGSGIGSTAVGGLAADGRAKAMNIGLPTR